MGWLTGKRRRALGIAILIAVPVMLAALLGAALMRPTSARDMLRSTPMFPGARHIEYASSDRSTRTIWEGDTARVAYQVDEQPEAVVAFYLDALDRGGWNIPDHSGNHADFFRTDFIPTGIHFSPKAPWITLEQDQRTRIGYVTAYRVTRNGVDITEVTLSLTPDATPGRVFIP